MHSSNLDRKGGIEMGQNEEGEEELLFLGIGITTDCFHVDGKILVDKEVE